MIVTTEEGAMWMMVGAGVLVIVVGWAYIWWKDRSRPPG
jgi:hypothetical protein